MPFPSTKHQFKKGQSGNPSGRPYGRKNLTTVVRDLLETESFSFKKIATPELVKLAKDFNARTGWQGIALVATQRALDGDIKAADWLARNAYGSRTVTEADPLHEPLTPDLAGEIEREHEVYRLGEQALTARELAEGNHGR